MSPLAPSPLQRSPLQQSPLQRGAVIGILGGGQLGRMTALAAYRLGFQVHVMAPEEGPATQVTPRRTLAPYTDLDALAAFAAQVDVVTCEFENVPAAAAQWLHDHVPVRPGPRALATCQDRIAEKSFLRDIGLPTAPWGVAQGPDDVAALAAELGRPCVLKSARMGYDGKGQVKLGPDTDPAAAWAAMAGHAAGVEGVVEGWVDFAWEGSVIVARGLDGQMAAYELVENRHRDHILHDTLAPAPHLTPDLARRARELALHAAQALDVVGLLAVELFIGHDGGLRVNELAARPHNSGHWTMDGAVTCQFEQCVRAVAGLPLGDPALRHPTRMQNLLGAEVLDLPRWLSDPRARVHLYGKEAVVKGRKMGHVNLVGG